MTKPDFSNEKNSVWLELKYIRGSIDVRKATEEIASDITKYSDNKRRSLFVIYDPDHRIVDEANFIGDIQRHDGNLVKIIR